MKLILKLLKLLTVLESYIMAKTFMETVNALRQERRLNHQKVTAEETGCFKKCCIQVN